MFLMFGSIMMWVWKIVFVFVVGCIVVMKFFEFIFFFVLVLCDLVKEVGILVGVINIVFGFGVIVGDVIFCYMDIDKVVFIGFVFIGWRIFIVVVELNFKKVILEFGGKLFVIVFDLVDVEEVVDWVVLVIWFNFG